MRGGSGTVRLRCHCPASLLPLTTANLLLSYSKHETRPPTQRVASATLISCSHRPILAGPAILTHPAPALEGAGGPRSGVQCTLGAHGARTHATWGHCDLMGGSRQGAKSRWAAPGKQSGLGGLRARSQLLKEFCLLWGGLLPGWEGETGTPNTSSAIIIQDRFRTLSPNHPENSVFKPP